MKGNYHQLSSQKIKYRILFLLVFFLFISCSKNKTGIKENLTDYENRNVAIPEKVNSVIMMSDSFLEYYIQICSPTKIIAIDSKTKKNSDFLIPFKVYPELLELPAVGTVKDPNYEMIIELNPDLIIIKSSGNQADVIQDKTGIPVFSTKMNFGLDFDAYMIIGKLFGEEKLAENKLDILKSSYKKLQELSASILESEKKTAYFALHTKNKNFSNTMISLNSLELCGGINIAKDLTNVNEWGLCSLTPEILLQWNPDFFFVDKPVSESSLLIEDVRNNELLKMLDSVKNNKLFYTFLPYDMPKNTVRIIAETYYLGKIIYPDVYKKDDTESELKKLAYEFYGKNWNEIQ